MDNVINGDLRITNPEYAFINKWENTNSKGVYISEVTDLDIIAFHTVLVMLLVLCILFIMPLSLLVFVQFKNFLNNQTTNIRFGKFKRTTVITDESQIPKGTQSAVSSEWNPSNFDRENSRRQSACGKACSNFFTMFCGGNKMKSQDEIISKYAADIGAQLTSESKSGSTSSFTVTPTESRRETANQRSSQKARKEYIKNQIEKQQYEPLLVTQQTNYSYINEEERAYSME